MITFIYWEDQDGHHHGIPLTKIKELRFQPGFPETDEYEAEDPHLDVYTEDETFEVEGKAASRAWDEIKAQIRQASGVLTV